MRWIPYGTTYRCPCCDYITDYGRRDFCPKCEADMRDKKEDK
jgi:transposase